MNVYEKLLEVQNKLKAPKSQYNSFGKYNYRNCEDILEAAKPICKEFKAVVFLTDKLVLIGDRYYVEATARFIDVESNESVTATAYAREEETKKGMDGSQVTGASSSYARKYALNGLFDIDDTKDSDTTNNGQNESGEKTPANGTKGNVTRGFANSRDLFTEINAAISAYGKQSGLETKNIVAHIEKQIGKKLDRSLSQNECENVLSMIKSWTAQ